MAVISELPHRTVSRAREVWHGFANSGFVKSKPVTLTVNTVRELGKDDATQMAAGVAYALCGLGGLARMKGDYDTSLDSYRNANGRFRRLGDPFGTAYSFCGIANARRMRDELPAAFRSFEKAGRIYTDIGGILSKIADFSTSVPDGTGNFTTFFFTSIDGGNVAFHGASGARLEQQGIYINIGGELQKVIDSSDPLDGKTLSSFGFSQDGLSGSSLVSTQRAATLTS